MKNGLILSMIINVIFCRMMTHRGAHVVPVADGMSCVTEDDTTPLYTAGGIFSPASSYLRSRVRCCGGGGRLHVLPSPPLPPTIQGPRRIVVATCRGQTYTGRGTAQTLENFRPLLEWGEKKIWRRRHGVAPQWNHSGTWEFGERQWSRGKVITASWGRGVVAKKTWYILIGAIYIGRLLRILWEKLKTRFCPISWI